MEVDIAGNRADFGAETSDLVCEHARGGDLDRVVPVVIVVTERVREVEDGHLGYLAGVLGDVEVGRLHRALGYGVRHEEKVELPVDDLRLLHEALVNIGALRRVLDEVLPVVSGRLLEESLANALVHDNERDFGGFELRS